MIQMNVISMNSVFSLRVFGSISPTCLRTTFTFADTKSAKIQSSHQCLFALLGSARVKAPRKTLVKSTLGCSSTSLWQILTYKALHYKTFFC